jgi:hypothetical protein
MRIFGPFKRGQRAERSQRYPVTVVVGQPIRFKKEDFAVKNRETYQRISEQVLATIAAIEKPG